MEVLRIHHVAFAHSSDTPVPRLLQEGLGLEVGHTEHGEGFVERMIPVGDSYVQLLEATGQGVVQRFLERWGPGLHHLAFEVPDVQAGVTSLAAAGAPLVDQAPRPGAMGTIVAFIHPSAFGGMLVELVQAPQMR
jgi:methylmalonyl-CoA/ethylmalonyl-CoA epimerase